MENSADPFPTKVASSPAAAVENLRLSLSSPLGLKSLLRTSRPRFGSLPWINVGVIALFFSFHMGLFVYGGLGISLPVRSNLLAQGEATTAVLTVRGENTFFFNGALSDAAGLPERLRAYLAERQTAHPVLLIKADAQLSLQVLFKTCEIAREAGFESAQIGGENKLGLAPPPVP